MRRSALIPLLVLLGGCGGGGAAAGTTIALTPPRGPNIYREPSGSMEPTYGIGWRVKFASKAPSLGAVIIFHPPQGAEQELCGPRAHMIRPGGAACARSIGREDAGTEFIKRVVAGPGDEIYVREGRVFRRAAGQSAFVREPDSHIRPCVAGQECNFPVPVRVPPGEWFLLGDNRGESDDSRFWGPVPTSWIVGVVTAVAWKPPF